MLLKERKLYFIVNPVAGGADARVTQEHTAAIKSACEKLGRDYTIAYSEYPGHSVKLACEAPADSLPVAVGGDGTVCEVAEGIVMRPDMLPMGIMPLGTGNDFCRSLGIKGDVEACVARICAASDYDKVDLMHVRSDETFGEKLCLNVLSAGYDVKVIYDHINRYSKWGLGRISYYISAFACCFSYKPIRMRIDYGEDRLVDRELFIADFCNGIYYGGGMKVNPDGNITDGLLNLNFIEAIKPFKVLRLLPTFIKGTYLKYDVTSGETFTRAELTIPKGCMVNLDGELFETETVTCEIEPGGLWVVR